MLELNFQLAHFRPFAAKVCIFISPRSLLPCSFLRFSFRFPLSDFFLLRTFALIALQSWHKNQPKTSATEGDRGLRAGSGWGLLTS